MENTSYRVFQLTGHITVLVIMFCNKNHIGSTVVQACIHTEVGLKI
ncbi:hypothetical protein ISN45_At03g031610 [Arabidopsis thaliana x Arabidopsis arenosa]|uniref:Uncharacterized protein n=1 Tax=Arabidopsis thaliana x Arabidopsis arenosa TaxID=1240361 RepID=A0A8T2EUW4_9BRAS|nr:hypothetical protein ISN45_At03g031610 [Arabidopsis thaliana x Arabidopsis arenosa]